MLLAAVAFATGPIGALVAGAFRWLVRRLLAASLLLWIAYAAGWFHRFLLWTAEREARRLLNGTAVTVGSLRTDLPRGRGWATNVVVHAPRPPGASWRWEAPVLARVGRVYVEANLVRCLFFLWFYLEEVPLELYTVHLQDIQVFVERRHNIYNFFLLDPHVILPDPVKDAAEETDNEEPTTQNNASSAQPTTPDKQTDGTDAHHPDTGDEDAPPTPQQQHRPAEEEQAQQVVDDMLTAVRRAAQEGDNWHDALLAHYRHTLTDQLKALTQKKKSVAMQEGVSLIRHVTASITEKSASAQRAVLPARRELPGERPVYGRVGRVLLQDLRIFLRDSHTWNKPIVIQRVAVRASEFCPPSQARDGGAADDALPALYQSLDVCLEVVWKRVLAEMAKSNTGRFFQTAIGEAADVFFTHKKKPAAATTPPPPPNNSSNKQQSPVPPPATTPLRE